jgi:IS5 family transposase
MSRNSREENKTIKEGQIAKEREKKQNRHTKEQKDTDARWSANNKERYYEYKDYIKIDKKSKIIPNYQTTSAEAHDSQELKERVDNKDLRIYADSAYRGEAVRHCLPKGAKNRIHEKGCRGRPLTGRQKRNTTAKSRVRAREEHVVARMDHFGGIMIGSIGAYLLRLLKVSLNYLKCFTAYITRIVVHFLPLWD